MRISLNEVDLTRDLRRLLDSALKAGELWSKNGSGSSVWLVLYLQSKTRIAGRHQSPHSVGRFESG